MDPLDRLRAECLALPEVLEKLSHESPSWFTGSGRMFASYTGQHHGSDRLTFWCAAPPGAQEGLVAARPGDYFRPPYVGQRGWLSVYVDRSPDWEELSGIVEEAYRCVANGRQLRKLEAARAG